MKKFKFRKALTLISTSNLNGLTNMCIVKFNFIKIKFENKQFFNENIGAYIFTQLKKKKNETI